MNNDGGTASTVMGGEGELRNSPAYKPFNPMRPFRRFIRVGKWLAKNKVGWMPCDLSVEPYPI